MEDDSLRLRERLLEGEPERVALVGARAAAAIDRVGEETSGAPDGEPLALEGGPDGPGYPPPPLWLRFDSIADCLQDSPAARRADVALLSLDAAPEALEGAGPLIDAVSAERTRALERALGTACRLFPARLLLLVEAPHALPPTALFAFGFRRLAVAPEVALHEYRLRDYKQPPEWLNARFWAHPERFDTDEDAEDDDDAAGLDGTDTG